MKRRDRKRKRERKRKEERRRRKKGRTWKKKEGKGRVVCAICKNKSQEETDIIKFYKNL